MGGSGEESRKEHARRDPELGGCMSVVRHAFQLFTETQDSLLPKTFILGSCFTPSLHSLKSAFNMLIRLLDHPVIDCIPL